MKTSLTSRERVDRTLRRQSVDRVAIDFGGSRITGIAAIAYRNLLEEMGRMEDLRLYDIKQQLADPSLAMINLMGGDVVQLQRLGPTTGMPFLKLDDWKAGQLTDGSPCLVPAAYDTRTLGDGTIEVLHEGSVAARRTPHSLYFDVCAAPLAGAATKADIDSFVWPDPWSEREAAFLRSEVQRLYHGTDKALFAGLPLMNCSFLEIGIVLFGYEQFMMNLVLEPELMEHWLDRMLEHDLEILGEFLAIAGPYISVIQMNDDFGAQDALQVSPDLYRKFFKPRQKQWVEFVKSRTDARVFIHCDGAIEQILPDFIEIGIDVLNPLQTSAKGMDPGKIKRTYGKDLCFWGAGVETQTTLPFGSVDEIKMEVRERIDLLVKDSGYVFATIHNIQADIPPEKILAIFETATGS
jgi:uroporphyrinogen decarboxylase